MIEASRFRDASFKFRKKGETMIYRSVSEMTGKTPLLELSNIEKETGCKAKIFAKCEFLNPTGSAKDRAAKEIIEDAERKGLLSEGGVIVEATSGNTGIGLASVAASRGYKAVIIMPDTMSAERIKLMRAYGAEVVLSDGKKGMAGSLEKLEEVKQKYPGCLVAGQFVNPANAEAHYKTTGPEIWEDTEGEVAALVAGIGTGGTITGTGRYLKEKNPSVKVIGMEPASSPLLTKGTAGPHGLQGIGANFVPDVLDRTLLDEVLCVTEEEAYEAARMLGRKEGIMVGISAGAALSAALKLAERPEYEGKTIVTVLPDSGDRYLSTDLF